MTNLKSSMGFMRLRGRHILVVEDDWSLATELRSLLELQGADVIGPAANLKSALMLIERAFCIDDAVLDIRLQDDLVFPAADKLRARGARIVFFSGYGEDILPPRFAHHVICPKPAENVVNMLLN